jgi:hypothetical protein
MAPPRPPAKRRRISVLEAVIVVVGFLAIIGYNRLNIVRLQRSLPNVNDKIVGEWKAERGTEHLVFRSDESVSMTLPAPAAEGSESAAEGTSGPPPVTGKYKLTQGGRIYVQLLNGKKYHTTISPINPNRFDLIDSDTDAVTTYDRVNAPAPGASNTVSPAPSSAGEASPAAPAAPATTEAPPSAAEEASPAAPAAPATTEAPPAPPSAAEQMSVSPENPSAAEASPPPASTSEAPAAAGAAEETPPAQAPKSPAAQKKKHR